MRLLDKKSVGSSYLSNAYPFNILKHKANVDKQIAMIIQNIEDWLKVEHI